MARHEVVIHENTSAATQGVAPYLGSYIAKETVALSEFASAVGAKCGLPAIQVIAIVGGAFEAIAALEREALVRVHTDLGVVCGVIKGSFPSADAEFDPARNRLLLALRLDDSLRLDLADVTPTIITDASLTKLRVDNVMDLEVERPMNLIHGRHTFRVAGFNMVLADEGAAAYLQNGQGTTFPLVIDHVTSHQLFTAHTAELLEAGDYKLVVKSRAGDAAGPLQTSFRKVKYLRVEDPPPGPAPELERGYSEGEGHPDGQVFPYYAFILQGVNLDGAAVKIGYAEEGAYREVDVPDEKLTVTDTVITIASDSVELEDAIMSGSATVTFKVTTAGGTATYEAEVQS